MRTQEASTISDVSQMLKPELKRRLERQLLDVTKQEGNARQRLLRAMSQVVTHPLLLGIDIVDIQKLGKIA